MEIHRKPIPENIQRRILKIFVTNIPDGCSGADLAIHVRPFGQIFDLYIARKRDKLGNRFGFISFLDVKDKADLLKGLRGIRMGDYKLWFNVARFVLEDGEVNRHKEESFRNEEHKNKGNVNAEVRKETNSGTSNVGDISFKEMLVGRSLTIDNNVNAFQSLHGKAVVARMVDLQALKRIKFFLKEFSLQDGKSVAVKGCVFYDRYLGRTSYGI